MAFQSPDQRGKMSMSESMSKLCLSDKFADVTFVFGSKKLRAHRVVLSMRSPVFEAMLYGPLSETPGCEIKIEDTDPETFRQFLWFLYTDDITLDGDSVLKILYLAIKYNLDILEDKCSNFLKTSINVDNVCTIYEHAGTFGQHELQRSCFDFITDKAAEVLCSHNFLAISKETLGRILSSNDLSIDEKSVFDAGLRWAKQQCRKGKIAEDGPNIRHHLGDMLYSIRLPLIPMDVFAEEICPSQVLTKEEENVLLRYIATTGATTTPTQTMVGSFLTNKREGKYFVVTIEDSEFQGKNMTLNQRQMIRKQKLRARAKINPALISVTWINRKNIKLHSIKCSEQFPVSNIKNIQRSCTRPIKQDNLLSYYNYLKEEVMETIDAYSGYRNPYKSDTHLKFELQATENTIVLQPPVVIEKGTCISVFSNNFVRAPPSQYVTNHDENGLSLQISSHEGVFDHLTFLREGIILTYNA